MRRRISGSIVLATYGPVVTDVGVNVGE